MTNDFLYLILNITENFLQNFLQKTWPKVQTKRYHIIIDIEGVDPQKLGRATVEKILNELPPLIDMHILQGPSVVEGIPENPGVSGFVIIDYSHISIHTFTQYNDFMIDIFSCKAYKPEAVVEYLSGVLSKPKEELKVKTVGWS